MHSSRDFAPRGGDRHHHHGGSHHHHHNNNHHHYGGRNQSAPVLEPQPLPKDPITLIGKCIKIASKCPIPKHDACNACSVKKRTVCPCREIPRLGTAPAWSVDELQTAKKNLNELRCKLDDLNIEEWKQHTSKTITTSKVVPAIRGLRAGPNESAPEMVTNAWCKMYELLRAFQFFDPEKGYPNQRLRTVHLCECPGGFICATNHFIRTEERLADQGFELDWSAVSLNPYYEGNDPHAMIDDDAFYRLTHRHWFRGYDDSGNIKSKQNIDNFYFTATNWSPVLQDGSKEHSRVDAHLVTADGSVDVQFDANQQEVITASLHFAEFVTACNLLAVGGHFVLKMFTVFEHHTISLLALMSDLFEQLYVAKPQMSRAGSGETYVVGKGFKGINSALLARLKTLVAQNTADSQDVAVFPREWVTNEFLEECIKVGTYFAQEQYDAIKRNFDMWEAQMAGTRIDEDLIRRERDKQAAIFKAKFAIVPLRRDQRLSPVYLSGAANNSTRTTARKRVGGLQSDRLKFRTDFVECQMLRQERAKFKDRFLCEPPPITQENAADDNNATGGPAVEVKEEAVSESGGAPESFGSRMMKKYNLSAGSGLGAHGQGPIEAITVQVKANRRGLQSKVDARTVSAVFDPRAYDKERVCEHDEQTRLLNFFVAKAEWCRTQMKRLSDCVQRPRRESRCLVPGAASVTLMNKVDKNWAHGLLGDWVTIGGTLLPHQVKISRFLNEELLPRLLQMRVESPTTGPFAMPPLHAADCWMLEGGRPRLDKPELELPHASYVALVEVISKCSALKMYDEFEADDSLDEHHLRYLIRQRFSHVCELSLDDTFPLSRLAAACGNKCSLYFYSEALFKKYEQFRHISSESNPAAQRKSALRAALATVLPPAVVDNLSEIGRLHLNNVLFGQNSSWAFKDQEAALTGGSRQFHSLVFVNALVDPLDCHPREYASTELRSKLQLLVLCTIALGLLASKGDLVIALRSTVTRFTATLIQLLSLAFEGTFVYRPPTLPPWTSYKYIYFRGFRRKAADKLGSPVRAECVDKEVLESYLRFVTTLLCELGPRDDPMCLLPPIFFTCNSFNQWFVEMNDRLAELELEDLSAHVTAEPDEVIRTQEERQALLLEYLEEQNLRGFFFPEEITPAEMEVATCTRCSQMSGLAVAAPPADFEEDVKREQQQPRSMSPKQEPGDYWGARQPRHAANSNKRKAPSGRPPWAGGSAGTGSNLVPVGSQKRYALGGGVNGGPVCEPTEDAIVAAPSTGPPTAGFGAFHNSRITAPEVNMPLEIHYMCDLRDDGEDADEEAAKMADELDSKLDFHAMLT